MFILKFLKKFIWVESIVLNNQITVLGWVLFVWQLKVNYQLIIDGIHGIMPYPNLWDSIDFIAVCVFYTFALFCTLWCRVFNFGVWAIYLICWCYVVYHLPEDLIMTESWAQAHRYAAIDALYIMHSGYFISLGLTKVEFYLINIYNNVYKRMAKWLNTK